MPEYHIAKTKRSCQWTLVDNDQFKAARGLVLWKSSTTWGLEKQLELAKRLKMCPRVCDIIGGGKRICGKAPKRDANKRTYCGKCKIDVKLPSPISGTEEGSTVGNREQLLLASRGVALAGSPEDTNQHHGNSDRRA